MKSIIRLWFRVRWRETWQALLFLPVSMLMITCAQNDKALFELRKASDTGVTFENTLSYTERVNPYTYKNFFNGGGVGIGDINNDGLPDIFFCGNMVSNKLYLNKGNFEFEDITESAGLVTENIWSAGVSIVDINADGWLDIYVCKSGPPGGARRYNELFINQGDNTFSEESSEYGLDNEGLSSHAAFFDYDRDGDLDCYLLNNSIKSIGGYDIIKDQRTIEDSLGGNKLLRNDDGRFVDVTIESGIYSSDIGFGLGVTIDDVNGDNWPDIYVSNDFFEKDYLYINQRDGSFKENLETYIKEISMGSMGADFADINNDGKSEIFVTEMLPERHDRLMSKALFESWDKHKLLLENGYHNQFGRNVLQLNNGDDTFSEIGRYSGVEATDWSWGALIFDMDNDGWKDLFVANGIYKDLLDLDYISFVSEPENVKQMINNDEEAIRSMIDMMPSEPLPNYAFKNNGDLTFSHKSAEWGFDLPTFSNGSAYGDLDNDGDLDLVINNVNMPASIYENHSKKRNPENNTLKVRLIGSDENPKAIGSKVEVYSGTMSYYQAVNPFRGFQSSVDYNLVFGLGKNQNVDSIKVVWPNGVISMYPEVAVNTEVTLRHGEYEISSEILVEEKEARAFFEKDSMFLDFKHNEKPFVDFDRDRLLFEMNSAEGPCICSADVNGDGLEDFYVGGASGQSGLLYIQQPSGAFQKDHEAFKTSIESEDLDCAFFDANGDGRPDLYVASGSSEFSTFDIGLYDRLYLNNSGSFTVSPQRLPSEDPVSSSTVIPFDLEDDGDLDLFVGGRQRAGYYGVPINSHLLINDGKGNFINETGALASGLEKIGMVTDAAIVDLDDNGLLELVVVGKWMSPKVFEVSNGRLVEKNGFQFQKYSGLYNTISTTDLDGDDRPDLVFGNMGLNTRYEASDEEPLGLLVNDFDDNGKIDLVTTMFFGGEEYPLVQLKDLTMQLPHLKKEFLRFEDYKNATIQDIFGDRVNKGGYHYHVNKLSSFVWLNGQPEGASIIDLPTETQLQPVYDFEFLDVNKDNIPDIVTGGNFFRSRPEMGSIMAGYGTLLLGQGNGKFESVSQKLSGFCIPGEIRSITRIDHKDKLTLLFGLNNDYVHVYKESR